MPPYLPLCSPSSEVGVSQPATTSQVEEKPKKEEKKAVPRQKFRGLGFRVSGLGV